MAKLVPIAIALVGLGAGLGAGAMLRPDAEAAQAADGDDAVADAQTCVQTADSAKAAAKSFDTPSDFVRLDNQFVVPLLTSERVDAMVVVAISLEIAQGAREDVLAVEPKLRDAFLRVLFDHATTGGFTRTFFNSSGISTLSGALTEAAADIVGPDFRRVLIVDLVKQQV